jgi:hypothetical protein
MAVLYGLSGMIWLLGQLQTGQGNLGKVENTRWDGWWGVYFHVRSSEGGCPCLCRLKITPVEPRGTSFDYVMEHTRFMGSHKLSSFMCCRDESCSTVPPVCTSGLCMGHPWMPIEVSHERRVLGWGGPYSSPWSHLELWPLMVPLWLLNVMLSGLSLAK